MPPPKRSPISTTNPAVDPRSPLLVEKCQPSQAGGSMAPPPPNAPKKRDLNKPKSLDLTSSAFSTLNKGIHPQSSGSIGQYAPNPSPSTSIAFEPSANKKKSGRSPLMSAPELGDSKWKGVIPQSAAPQTSVSWRSRSNSSGRRWKRQTTSSAFLTAGRSGTNIASARSNYFQNLPSAASAVSHRSTGSSSSKLTPVRSTELVVKKNSRFDVPVSSGKSIFFG